MNLNLTDLVQSNYNISDHDATAASVADSGGNGVLGGLLAINALNPATATAASVNLSPVTQANVGTVIDAILDASVEAEIL